MQEPWDLTPATGDQCALCADLLEGDAATIELDDGKLLHVCGACAADRAAAATADEEHSPAREAFETATEHARALVAEMIEQRTRELAALQRLAGLIERQDEELARSQMSGLGLEERVLGLEAELERTRGQLRRAEDLMAAPQTAGSGAAPGAVAGSAAGDHVAAARFPEPAPELVVNSADLTGEDVRISQRLFNESPHVEKTRGVRRSLGRPIVNLARVAGGGRKTLLTAAWDIIWYQYLLDLSPDPDGPAVTLFAEGMELSELSSAFKEANGIIDDQGRFDASELELSLERDHPAHIAAQADEGAHEADDATQEIWDKTSMPEFRWED